MNQPAKIQPLNIQSNQSATIESTSNQNQKRCPIKATLKKEGGSSCLEIKHIEDPNFSNVQKANEIVKLTGAKNGDLADLFLHYTLEAFPNNEQDSEHTFNMVIQGLYEMNPKDVFEGMLCSQALALYTQGMENLTRAGKANCLERSSYYYKVGMKLLRLSQDTIEKLEKYRRKGQQNVHVEHVHVHSGGKAIVGNIQTERGVE